MSERQEFLKLLYERALRLESASHAEFLSRECGDDQELRLELEELLEWKSSGGFLSEPIPRLLGGGDLDTNAECVDARVGSYRLLERIASGGMGTVWRATRDDEAFAKEVAIKLIKQGMDSNAVIQRFHRERRLLARLEHPGIAQLLDGGTSASGQPFMVMELVRGVLLDIGVAPLPLRARLELFVKICDAVDAAHEHGIVHRDLKPSNILITPEGQPKLLDFGIAKVLSGDSLESTLLTRTAERLLTPRYAAPEQVLGGEITTATDVFALGVMLYEILCERSPYQHYCSVRELETAICEELPSRPSGHTRGTTRRRLRGDLDTIVMRALAKEATRRYPRAGALAADIRRHLSQEPIFARRDSWLYRSATFARRNRWTLTVCAAIVCALSVGLVLAKNESQFAERMRSLAESRAAAVIREAARSHLSAATEAIDSRRERSARGFLDSIPLEHRFWEWEHLQRRLDRSIARSSDPRLRSKEKGQCVVWMPDGEQLAIAALDGKIHLVSRGTMEVTRSLPGHRKTEALAVSVDGAFLAFCYDDSRVGRVDVATGKGLRSLRYENDKYRCVDFSPVDRLLVAGTETGKVRFFDPITGTLRRSADLGSSSTIRALRFAPSGKQLAVTCARAKLHLFDLDSGTWTREYRAHESQAFCVAWSPNERRIVTGSMDRSVSVMDAASGDLLGERLRFDDVVWTCAFLPSGAEIVAGGPYILRADASRGRELASFCGRGSMALSPDGQEIAVVSAEGLRIYASATQGVLRTEASTGWTRGLAVSPDGRLLAVVDRGWGGLYERNGGVLRKLPGVDFRGEEVLFDGSGERMVVLRRNENDEAEVRQAPDWKVVRRIAAIPATRAALRGNELIASKPAPGLGFAVLSLENSEAPRFFGEDIVHTFELRADGGLLASIAVPYSKYPDRRCALELWDPSNLQRIARQDLEGEALAVAFAPDGTIVVGGFGGLEVWSADAAQLLRKIPREAAIQSIAFRDAQRFATNDAEGSVWIWDAQSWRPIVELARHQGPGFRLAWSADGSLLASGGQDGIAFAIDGPALAEAR